MTSHIFCEILKYFYHMLFLAFIFSFEFRIVCRNTGGAGIFFANPSHYTAFCNQKEFAKVEPLSAQHGGRYNIGSGLESAICPQFYKSSETMFAKSFMNFKQTDFPGKSGVLHGSERCGSCSAVTSRNVNHISSGFGNSNSNRPNVFTGNKFDIYFCGRLNLLELVNQLF